MAAQRRNRIQATFTLDPEVMEQVRDAAWADRMSASRYIERAVLAWLAEHPPPVAPAAD